MAARVAELRLLFIATSAGFLGAAYYFAYRRSRGSRFQRMALWVATPLTVLFWLLPLFP